MAQAHALVPVEIGRANAHDVKITWQDQHVSIYPARELRLRCPCAGCVDEMTGVVRLIESGVPQDVRPSAIHPIGRYAISIDWSDGHRTGIYAYELLRKLCPCCRAAS